MSTEEMQENHSVEDILSIIRSQKSPKVISDELSDYHANDIADALPELTKRERLNLYRLLDVDALSEVFEYTEDNSEQYLEELDPKKAAEILGNMETDTAVDILKECKSPQKKLWLELMSPETRTSLQMLAAYDEDQIGSRMTTNFVTLKSSMGIKEAMRSVVNQAADNDNISVIYVLDEKGVYYGALDLKDLIIAREGQKLEDLISTGYPYVYADEQIDDCLSEIQDYSEESIPVLSDDNHILGVITASDVAQVVDDEMGEDYAKLGGLSAEEDLNEPLKKSVQKRLPWLVLLLLLAMAGGCLWRSDLLHLSLSGYRERLGLRLALLALVLYVAVVLALTAIPHAVLLSATGQLFPSPFSRALIPILSFGVFLLSAVYGWTAGRFTSFADIVDSLLFGIGKSAPLILFYIMLLLFCESFKFVFM